MSREIDEELESHIREAIEQGRHPAEARRAFGPALLRREESRDIRLIPWLDSLGADTVFGWRQLKKNKVTSAAAVLSLALAIGACTSAFRLIDALLLQPLPVAEPERLYVLLRQGIGPDGKPRTSDSYEYPLFREMRAAVKNQAELIAVSYPYAGPVDLTCGSHQEVEKAYRQYVSGWMFGSLGLRPALGRLFTENDNLKPGAHAYAVLSHEYWTRRFRQDPNVIGRTFHMGTNVYVIIGVAERRFTGTEPGTVIDIFVPTMMNASAIDSLGTSWFRTLVLLAMLALFFGLVSLLLAGVGLYGVLDYSVLRRRREIGIRRAIGAQAGDIARRVTVDVFCMVLVGALAGLSLGMVSVRYIETLLYQVRPTDLGVLALPSLTIVAAALLAALPAVIHAVRIDPVKMLRAE